MQKNQMVARFACDISVDPLAFGRRVVALRKSRGLSVADVQVYFGFDAPQAIYKWQKGESIPNTENLLALSRLFRVSMDYLVTGEPYTEPDGSVFLQKSRLGRTTGRNPFGGHLLKFFSRDAVPPQGLSAPETLLRGLCPPNPLAGNTVPCTLFFD